MYGVVEYSMIVRGTYPFGNRRIKEGSVALVIASGFGDNAGMSLVLIRAHQGQSPDMGWIRNDYLEAI